MNATATHCEEVCGTCIEIAGRNRTGPSLCFQDYYLAPLYLVAVGVLLANRVKELNDMPLAQTPHKYWTSKDFILVVVLLAHSLYGLAMVEGGASAGDNTVRTARDPWHAPLRLLSLPCVPCRRPLPSGTDRVPRASLRPASASMLVLGRPVAPP